MRAYRTVFADLECASCKQSYGADVQFETGADAEIPVYAEGDEVADLAPGARFEGRAERYCVRCVERWSDDEAAARFAQIADEVREGELRMLKLRWPDDEHASRDSGVPDPDQPLSPDDVRDLGRGHKNVIRGIRHVWSRLGREEVALVLRGGGRVSPRRAGSWATEGDEWTLQWVAKNDDAVRARLEARGWPAPADEASRVVTVSIDADRCVRVER